MIAAEIVQLLLSLGTAIRDKVCKERTSMIMASRVAETGGSDTIFALDRTVEAIMFDVIRHWPRSSLPVGIFAEGLREVPAIIGDGHDTEPKFWLLIDPIDGTRELMFDKRSAYFTCCGRSWFRAAPAVV